MYRRLPYCTSQDSSSTSLFGLPPVCDIPIREFTAKGFMPISRFVGHPGAHCASKVNPTHGIGKTALKVAEH
jgi:hypothetical protein